MTNDLLTRLQWQPLSNKECADLSGGAGIEDNTVAHMSCLKRAYKNSIFKTLLLGVTVFGMARNLGIMVGCSGA